MGNSELQCFELSIRTSFVLAAEAGSLFEGSGGESQASTLLQAMLQHGFKLCTQTDDPEQRGETVLHEELDAYMNLSSSGNTIFIITRSQNTDTLITIYH